MSYGAELRQQASGVQSDETELLLDEVNSYQRAIQYQQLEKAQFGASKSPGFYFEVRPPRIC